MFRKPKSNFPNDESKKLSVCSLLQSKRFVWSPVTDPYKFASIENLYEAFLVRAVLCCTVFYRTLQKLEKFAIVCVK